MDSSSILCFPWDGIIKENVMKITKKRLIKNPLKSKIIGFSWFAPNLYSDIYQDLLMKSLILEIFKNKTPWYDYIMAFPNIANVWLDVIKVYKKKKKMKTRNCFPPRIGSDGACLGKLRRNFFCLKLIYICFYFRSTLRKSILKIVLYYSKLILNKSFDQQQHKLFFFLLIFFFYS